LWREKRIFGKWEVGGEMRFLFIDKLRKRELILGIAIGSWMLRKQVLILGIAIGSWMLRLERV
jgi:hypothetical protein